MPSQTNLAEVLQDQSIIKPFALIGSEWIEGKRKFAVTNPATGKEIINVADVGRGEILAAIENAQHAFTTFGRTSEYERATMLRKWASLLLTLENGKTLAEAAAEVEYGASYLDWFAEEAIRSYGDTIPSRNPATANFVIRQPVGVCAIIAPWNFPIAMITRKLGPAIAAGCTAIVKPPRETPLCTSALGHLALQAGIPPGVIQIVPSTDRAATAELYTHPAIRKVSFTGSTNVGKIISEQAIRTMKRFSMELGGNAPFIVFDDADIDVAVEGAVNCKFRGSGQTCVCANLLYVQRGIHDKFTQRLADRMRSFVVGSGLDPKVTHGPLVNDAAVQKVRTHIEDALAKGATLVMGGTVPKSPGFFIEPALMTGITGEMIVTREETFGPLAAIRMFDTVEEVIESANNTEFGLAGYFFSQNLQTIWRVARALEVGMVGVNTGKISAAEVPFGGVKESGVGREGSRYGLAEYQVMKTVTIGGLPA
ncbi:Aldehyde/histidinol dehydrogenase [Aspergillus pseudotamarii]|uniref:succinate-semialdehyde dehydrogenase [NAD(P)(+)] n=1 Tax=Aspergillus pseudotamarii TaxID=132259 RepID=A0A5N6TBR3_ASPPS|nr:Aldehyde/histidinol dehydrogenase [Aspergillus pseudotamarii]KAE8143814.1 Aldehyde/histidinol dehydrogenase [Aspergillus pseudotamarii]